MAISELFTDVKSDTGVSANIFSLRGEAIRASLEAMYEDSCNIYCLESVKRENGSTGQEWALKYKEQPCRISYSNAPANDNNGRNGVVNQGVKVFLAPEVTVVAGSKIEVVRGSTRVAYKASGQPAVYASHQEINLELEDRSP